MEDEDKKTDYVKFIVYALSSNGETIDHLETLYETGALTNEKLYLEIHKDLIIVGKRLTNFLKKLDASN
jgi:four helix bundle protein